MRQFFTLLFLIILFATSSCKHQTPEGFVLVKGGVFVNTSSKYYGKRGEIPDFYVGKDEVTQKEWIKIMENNPSKFKGDDLPVEMVNWYDCIEYCNKRSVLEGLKPYYNIDKMKKDIYAINNIDTLRWNVSINKDANGYRLPTNAEWEYAAGGGQLSKSYIYSGSDNIDDVAWYWKNSGDKYLIGSWSWATLINNRNKTRPAGKKKPNELGLYDMSGNVREWCWDRHKSNDKEGLAGRVWAGGGWLGSDFCCESVYQASFEASGKGPDQGFRLWRGI